MCYEETQTLKVKSVMGMCDLDRGGVHRLEEEGGKDTGGLGNGRKGELMCSLFGWGEKGFDDLGGYGSEWMG